MDQTSVREKWAKADALVASIPEPERSAARVAVMTALLLEGNSSSDGGAKVLGALTLAPSKISSVRQLSRFTRGKTGTEVVLLLAWFLKTVENRGITAKECRTHWSLLAEGIFATTFIH